MEMQTDCLASAAGRANQTSASRERYTIGAASLDVEVRAREVGHLLDAIQDIADELSQGAGPRRVQELTDRLFTLERLAHAATVAIGAAGREIQRLDLEQRAGAKSQRATSATLHG